MKIIFPLHGWSLCNVSVFIKYLYSFDAMVLFSSSSNSSKLLISLHHKSFPISLSFSIYSNISFACFTSGGITVVPVGTSINANFSNFLHASPFHIHSSMLNSAHFASVASHISLPQGSIASNRSFISSTPVQMFPPGFLPPFPFYTIFPNISSLSSTSLFNPPFAVF